MRTRNGIYLNLIQSTYRFKTPDTGYTFVFSSDLHLTKFEERYKENRIEVNTKNKSRMGINIDMKVLPDILLYKRIENRGFLILDEGGQKICQENLILTGEKATLKS